MNTSNPSCRQYHQNSSIISRLRHVNILMNWFSTLRITCKSSWMKWRSIDLPLRYTSTHNPWFSRSCDLWPTLDHKIEIVKHTQFLFSYVLLSTWLVCHQPCESNIFRWPLPKRRSTSDPGHNRTTVQVPRWSWLKLAQRPGSSVISRAWGLKSPPKISELSRSVDSAYSVIGYTGWPLSLVTTSCCLSSTILVGQ